MAGRHIVEEGLELRVGVLADRVSSAAEMEHRRRGQGDLRGSPGGRLQVLKCVEQNRLHMPDLVRDVHDRRSEVHGTLLSAKAHRAAALGDDALQLLEKIDVKVRPAKLAVGDALETRVLLELDDLGDRLVLDRAERRPVDLASREALASIEQLAGTEEAADMVGPKR